VPVEHGVRLIVLVAALAATTGVLIWLLKNAPIARQQQRRMIDRFARENEDIFTEFVEATAGALHDLTVKLHRAACRCSDLEFTAEQQTVLSEYSEVLGHLGYRYLGPLVTVETAGGVKRVDDGQILLTFVNRSGTTGVALICGPDRVLLLEAETELEGGTFVLTVRVVKGTAPPVGSPTLLLDVTATSPGESPQVAIDLLLSRHGLRVAEADAAPRVRESSDDHMASQRRQEALGLRRALTQGIEAPQAVAAFATQALPWYWSRSAREEMTRQFARRLADWRPSGEQLAFATNAALNVPYDVEASSTRFTPD
jgi:hypothetical protein